MKLWLVGALAATGLTQAAVHALRPVASYETLSFGGNAFDLGVVASAYAVLPVLLAIPVGRWTDRWGGAIFIRAGCAMIFLAAIGSTAVEGILHIVLAQSLLGVGQIVSLIGLQAVVANRGAATERANRLGYFVVFLSMGQLIGPAVVGIFAGPAGVGSAPVGAGTVYLAATLMALAAAAIAMVISSSDALGSSGGHRASTGESGLQALGRVLGIPSMPQAMFASLIVLATVDLLAVYLPALGESRGISASTIGFLLAARAGASMVSRLLLLPMLRAFGHRRLLAASLVLASGPLLTVPLLQGPTALLAAMIIAGFGLGLGQPITLIWVAARVPNDIRATAMAARLTGNRLGQAVLPLGIGVLAAGAGISGAFIALGTLLALGSGLTLGTRMSEEPEE